MAFCFPAFLQFQNLDEAWVSLDQMFQADNSRPLTGFMLLPTKELPVAIFMRDQSYGSASFEHMATHECSTFTLHAQLQIVALELTFLGRNPVSLQLFGPFLAVAISA